MLFSQFGAFSILYAGTVFTMGALVVGWATMQLAHPIICLNSDSAVQGDLLNSVNSHTLFQQFTRTCLTLLTLLLLRRILPF